jgi:glycosyltransferase involved in cell wall biosynthesis
MNSSSLLRPRVVQLLAIGTVGGAQESATALIIHLDRSRFEVEAIALADGAAVRRLHDLGYPVTVLGAGDDAATIRELTALLRRREVDLLHAHMFRAELLGTRAARAASTPVVVATVHSSRVRSPQDIADLAAVTPFIDRLIAPSESIAAKVRREGRGATEITVVPNGVDADRFGADRSPTELAAIRAALGIPADAFVVGVVARLEPEKGHRYLIEAWPAIANARADAWLVLIGEGSQADALRAQARALPASVNRRIVFGGRQADVAAVTAALDVAVMPSLREAQGIAILEALAARRPVVASRVGGIPETIRHGVHGLLVPPADPPALARAILRLATDPKLRARLGAAGARRVEEVFSVTASVRRVESIYLNELAAAGVPALTPRFAPHRV